MKSFLPCVQTRNITTTIPALNKQIESQVKKQNQLDFSMPQWVQLPPNLVPEKHTMGKSIYTTDYSRKRPGFQLHLQNARGFRGSKHRPQAPKVLEIYLTFATLSHRLHLFKRTTSGSKLIQRLIKFWLHTMSQYYIYAILQ